MEDQKKSAFVNMKDQIKLAFVKWWDKYRLWVIGAGLSAAVFTGSIAAQIALDDLDIKKNNKTLLAARQEYQQICKAFGCTQEEALAHVQVAIDENHQPNSKYKHPRSSVKGIRPTTKETILEQVNRHNDGFGK